MRRHANVTSNWNKCAVRTVSCKFISISHWKNVIVILLLSTSQSQSQLKSWLTIFSRNLSVLTCHFSPLLEIIENSLSTTAAKAANTVLQTRTTRATLMTTRATATTTISRTTYCPRHRPRKLIEFISRSWLNTLVLNQRSIWNV